MSGYIKVSRSLLESDLWVKEPFSKAQAWLDLIALAKWKDGVFYAAGRKYEIKRGQICWSMTKLAERWSWSKGKVLRFMDVLEGELQIERQTEQHFVRISVCNYDKYQDIPATSGAPDGTPDRTPDGTPDRTPDGTPDRTPDGTHTNKGNKGKEGNKEKEGAGAPERDDVASSSRSAKSKKAKKSKVEKYFDELAKLDWSKWPGGVQPTSAHWVEWMTARAEKNAAVSDLAMDLQRENIVEAVRLGYDADEIYRLMGGYKWVGFKLEMAEQNLKIRRRPTVAASRPLAPVREESVDPRFVNVLKGMQL